LRKYTKRVKKLRQRSLYVTLMWWNDDCKQRGLEWDLAQLCELLTPWITRTDRQQDGEQVDGICRKLIQTG
jgi:hypothetical protein